MKRVHFSSEVDEEVTRFYLENDLMHLWRHHTGHALGMLGHEAPFFDTGDNTIMEPGMVFSVEPGLCVMGLEVSATRTRW